MKIWVKAYLYNFNPEESNAKKQKKGQSFYPIMQRTQKGLITTTKDQIAQKQREEYQKQRQKIKLEFLQPGNTLGVQKNYARLTANLKFSENQQASGRVNVQSRAYHSKLNLNLKLFKKDSHQKAYPKGQNSKVQSARSTPQKNSTSGLKKSKQKQPKISKSQEKDRALQIKTDNMNVERQKAYLQKYFGKYFKKLNPHSAR